MKRHEHWRWFQWSLASLFLLTLLVATFFAGYSLATKQAEAERRRAELEARAAEESRQQAEAQQRRAITRAWSSPAGISWPQSGMGETP